MQIKSKPFLVLVISLFALTACTTSYTNQDNNSNSQSQNMDNSQTPTSSSKLDMYSAQPPVLSQEEMVGKTATIKTKLGDIKIKFFEKDAPQTVSNFMFLAQEGFYNGLSFHRRVEGFVLQGGDPAGTGSGGPGYNVPAEINKRSHQRGIVATARLADEVNPSKASSGSQFYIVLAPATFLDGQYTVFGEVVEGMEIVDKLQMGDLMDSVTIN
jgi:peptidyl-prolyl cis-trans isomerase B (cyclophilin B)